MKFVNIRRLKDDLARGPLSARETAGYLAAQGMLLSILFVPMPAEAPEPWAFIVYPAIALAGVYYCYRQNGAASGERLPERYLALGWVVGVRIAIGSLLIALAASLVIGFTALTLDFLESPYFPLAMNVVGVGLSALVYWRLGVHLADVRRRTY